MLFKQLAQASKATAPHKPRPLPTLALAISLSLTGLTVANAAYAETSEQTSHSFSIDAGTLDAALVRFGQQSGVLVSVSGDVSQSKQAAGLEGDYPVEQGLELLLQGTDLQAVRQANGSYVVEVRSGDGAMTLPPVTVSADGLSSTTEHTGSYSVGVTNTATKLQMTPRNTPQIVNSVTHQMIEDFAMQDMEDVMVKVPGVNVGHADDDRRTYTARGYSMAVQYDGLPSTSGIDGGVVAGPDTAVIDHVDVLIGAAGLMNGAGQPGGVINMVLKRPTESYQASLSASAGAWDMRRIVGDISGSVDESGRLRARLVAVDQAAESFRDHEKEKKKVFYAIVESDITESTLLSFSVNTQDIYDNVTDRSGLPTDNDGNDLNWSRSTFLVPAWNRWDKYSTNYRTRVEQQLGDEWQLVAQVSHLKSEAEWLFGAYDDFDSTTGDATFSRWAQHNEETSDDVEFFLRGPVELFGRNHEIVVGGNWTERVWGGRSGDGTDFVANLYLFDPQTSVPRPELSLDEKLTDQITKQYGGYVAAKFSVTDSFTAITGSRLSWYDYEYGTTSREEKAEVTPYIGLIYDLNSWSSAYFSYTDIFNPQSARGTDGNTLAPEVGTSAEIGIKGEFYDGKLNTSITAFRIRKDNEAQLLQPYDANNICGGWCYAAKGETTTNGVDLGVSGEIVDGLKIMAGFTQFKKNDNDKNVRIAKLSGSYSPGGHAWSVGASIDHSTKSFGMWGMTQDARTLVDLFGRYQITPQLHVALNIENLLDEEYYANAIDSGYGNQYWGKPRSWSLTLEANW